MHSLLSDWMEHDLAGSHDDESIGAATHTTNNKTVKESTSPLSAQRRKKLKSNKNKKKWRKLQWRPPGMAKTSSSNKQSSKSNNPPTSVAATATTSSSSARKKNASTSSPSKNPRLLPPLSSSPRKQQFRTPTKKKQTSFTPTSPPSSSGASVTTFRSNTSLFTTKSTATQKHSNRTASRRGGAAYSPSQASSLQGSSSSGGSASSLFPSVKKSSTPPVARYRRRRRTALDLLPRRSPLGRDEVDTADAVADGHVLETSSINNDSLLLLAEDENNQDNDEIIDNIGRIDIISRQSDEQTHVTFENMKIQVTKNYNDAVPQHIGDMKDANNTSGDSTLLIMNNSCGGSPLDEAQHLLQDTCATGSAMMAQVVGRNACHRDLLNNMTDLNTASSPTSVGLFPNNNEDATLCGMSIPFDECSHYAEGISDKMNKLRTNAGGGKGGVDDDVLTDEEDDTIATNEEEVRKPGPIDIDTCARHLTPTERRLLRAMHQLGYTHLVNSEYPQSIEIFSEILRGQQERHGKRSLQAAVAMHNLGVVCMKCGMYKETVRLTDGAARIRVERLGKDHLDVAMSLAQQGVALMELKEHGVGLASFREALRIRNKATWDDHGDHGGVENNNHPLIVRLLNNIGCALFEMNELAESRLTFENALRMQRELMRVKNKKGMVAVIDNGDDPFDIDPKDAYHAPLSIALTLTNLGSIHLRMREFDKSLVYYEEAVLIQESVLGEEHGIAMSTKESINFVVQSKEKQDERNSFNSNAGGGEGVKIDRIAGFLPYVSYEESKRIYNKMQNEISAAIDAVSSNTCHQTYNCVDEERTYTTG